MSKSNPNETLITPGSDILNLKGGVEGQDMSETSSVSSLAKSVQSGYKGNSGDLFLKSAKEIIPPRWADESSDEGEGYHHQQTQSVVSWDGVGEVLKAYQEEWHGELKRVSDEYGRSDDLAKVGTLFGALHGDEETRANIEAVIGYAMGEKEKDILQSRISISPIVFGALCNFNTSSKEIERHILSRSETLKLMIRRKKESEFEIQRMRDSQFLKSEDGKVKSATAQSITVQVSDRQSQEEMWKNEVDSAWKRAMEMGGPAGLALYIMDLLRSCEDTQSRRDHLFKKYNRLDDFSGEKKGKWLKTLMKEDEYMLHLNDSNVLKTMGEQLVEKISGKGGQTVPKIEVLEGIRELWDDEASYGLVRALKHIAAEHEVRTLAGFTAFVPQLLLRLLKTVSTPVGKVVHKWMLNTTYNPTHPCLIPRTTDGELDLDELLPSKIEELVNGWQKQLSIMCSQAQVNINTAAGAGEKDDGGGGKKGGWRGRGVIVIGPKTLTGPTAVQQFIEIREGKATTTSPKKRGKYALQGRTNWRRRRSSYTCFKGRWILKRSTTPKGF